MLGSTREVALAARRLRVQGERVSVWRERGAHVCAREEPACGPARIVVREGTDGSAGAGLLGGSGGGDYWGRSLQVWYKYRYSMVQV